MITADIDPAWTVRKSRWFLLAKASDLLHPANICGRFGQHRIRLWSRPSGCWAKKHNGGACFNIAGIWTIELNLFIHN